MKKAFGSMPSEEENPGHFSDTLNGAIGFDSTWNTHRSINLVSRDIETDKLPAKKDQSSATEDVKSIATQTECTNNFGHVNEQELSKWLKDIYPMIEKELQQGVTNVFDFSKSELSGELSFHPIQTICAIDKNSAEIEQKNLIHGYACWLSVSTQNAPLLAIASSYSHDVWCNHSSAIVKVFQPVRNKMNNSVNYQELKTFPVKSCINALVTNRFNKDILAGGTFAGDLYIWKYEIRNVGGDISEKFSETSQFGTIVGITWMKANAMNQDYDLLTCHFDGIVVLWKIGKVIVKDKIFKIKSLNDPDELAVLSSIVSISKNKFIVGTEDGRIILCSLSQSQNNKSSYDPVVNDLDSHKFAVPTLIQSKYRDQPMIITCDISGVACFRSIGENSVLWKTVKIPMPFKGKICCTQNLQHLLSAGPDGTLDVFTVATEMRKSFQGHLQGLGDTIAISENGHWIVIGSYQGAFKIFKLDE